MEVMNKKRRDYVYLFSDSNKKEAFYLDEQNNCFYKIKTETYDMKYGFLALLLAPLNLILTNVLNGNLWGNFFIACITGFILGFLFIVIVNKSFFKRSFEEVVLTGEEMERSLHNLKEVFKIKCTLVVGWIVFFLISFTMFSTEKNYKSLISISIIFMFLYPLVTSLDFIQYRRVRRLLSQLISEEK